MHACIKHHVWVNCHFKILIPVQLIPRNIRGAVIGYGLLCDRVKGSENGNPKVPLAVEVIYGHPGFALSLARIFDKVHVTAEHTLIMYYVYVHAIQELHVVTATELWTLIACACLAGFCSFGETFGRLIVL